jgi:hypothetical protein
MHLSVQLTDKQELKDILEILKEHITSVEISMCQSDTRTCQGGGYSEPIPGVTQVSKRGFCKSIPTVGVNGIEYRSRVESKWAYMFEGLGWEWTYEPEDSPGYIPDFCLVWGDEEIVVEVKSNSSFGALSERFEGDYEKAAECMRRRLFLLVGGAVWKTDEGTCIGIVYDGVSKRKYNAYVIGDGFDNWKLKLKSVDGITVLFPKDGKELIEAPTHKTLNSMWISAGNKTQWKPRE